MYLLTAVADGFAMTLVRNETQRHSAVLKSASQNLISLLPLDGIGSDALSFQLRPVFAALSNRVSPGNAMSCFVGFGDKSLDNFKNFFQTQEGVRTNSWTIRSSQGWTGQGFLDGKISFFRQHLALGRTGRYSRSMSASSACCSRARCI